jgi:hypothetical protein
MKLAQMLGAALLTAVIPVRAGAQKADGVTGTWLYRSFINETTPVAGDAGKALGLIFGEGVLRIAADDIGQLKGTIEFGDDYVLDISGRLQQGAGPSTIVLRGTGRLGTGTAGWLYDYQAFPAPTWPRGVDQKPALVGSVIRTVQHGGGRAGFTASFIAVKTD